MRNKLMVGLIVYTIIMLVLAHFVLVPEKNMAELPTAVVEQETEIYHGVWDDTTTVSGQEQAVLRIAYKNYLKVNPMELGALSVALYCEARGESSYGIAAVADTIRNRVSSKLFPNTYYRVVTQHKQISCIKDTTRIYQNIVLNNSGDRKTFNKIILVAYRTISGDMPTMTYDALFYHTVSVHPYWAKKYDKLGVVGHHVFYTTSKL